jgi:hypothetical protein
LVLKEAKQGRAAEVWFRFSTERKLLEAKLISELEPPWNGRLGTESDASVVSEGQGEVPVRRGRSGAGAVTAEGFRSALRRIFSAAEGEGKNLVIVRAGDLHEIVGGYPGPAHRMPVCCSAMRSEMDSGDRITQQPPKGNGANFFVQYQLPRRQRRATFDR